MYVFMDVFCLFDYAYVCTSVEKSGLYKLAQKRSKKVTQWNQLAGGRLAISQCFRFGHGREVAAPRGVVIFQLWCFCWDCFLPKGSEIPVNIEILTNIVSM